MPKIQQINVILTKPFNQLDKFFHPLDIDCKKYQIIDSIYLDNIVSYNFNDIRKRDDCFLYIENLYVPDVADPNEYKIPVSFKKGETTDNVIHYKNIMNFNSQELKYLDCMDEIIKSGDVISDRTGIGTLSVFDMNMQFDINVLNLEDQQQNYKYDIPIFTTKSLYFKGIVLELLWFLNGHTDTKLLSDKGVHIWDGNTSREALDKLGLDYPEGELGPGYGHQWVNWGGNLNEKNGINQIENIINTLKTDPFSRRIVLNAWNVGDLNKMALPPCHMMYIFKTTKCNLTNRNKLNCKVILRSNDMFLGNPFNVVSASVLTILISKCVGMIPGKISLSICDAHIYTNHIIQVKTQLERVPLETPYLTIEKDISTYDDITKLEYEDFKLSKYKSWPKISASMAV